MTKYGTWYGKDLEEYSKEELLDIIVKIGEMKMRDDEQHMKDLEFFSSLNKKTK